MLKTFRGIMQGVGKWILLALIVLAFAVVGLQSPPSIGGNDAVRVGDRTYGLRAVEDEFSRRLQNEQFQRGEVLSREQAVAEGLLQQAVTYFIRRGIIAEEAERLGLTVTDEMVQTWLRSEDGITNPETGSFDREYLARVLSSNNLSLSEFQARVKSDLLSAQLEDGLLVPTPAPAGVADLYTLRQTEERDLSIATFSAEDLDQPEDDVLRSFYEANADRYRLPEQRRFTVATLDPESVRDRVDIAESELEQLYAARADGLGSPETRSFAQGQFGNQEAAAEALADVKDGVSFDEAVTAAGGMVTRFSDETRDALADDAVADLVFSTDGAGLAGPVDGIFGTVIVNVTDVTEGDTVTFEEARPALEDELFQEIAAAELDALVDELFEAGDAGATLREAAEPLGVETITYGPLAATDAAPEGLPADVLGRVFFLQEGAFFEEVPLEDEGYAFLELEEVIPATPQPFESVRDRVAQDYLAEEREEQLASLAANLEARVLGGEDFEDAVEALGGAVLTRTVEAGTPPEGLSPSLFLSAFTDPIGEIATETAAAGGSLTAVQVRNLRFGPNAQFDSTAAQVRQQFGAQLTRDLYEAYLMAADEEIGVEVAEDSLAARFGETN